MGCFLWGELGGRISIRRSKEVSRNRRSFYSFRKPKFVKDERQVSEIRKGLHSLMFHNYGRAFLSFLFTPLFFSL